MIPLGDGVPVNRTTFPALAVILRNALKRNALKLLNELDSSTITKSQLPWGSIHGTFSLFDKSGYHGYTYTPKSGAYDAVMEQIADICMSMPY
jgi:hypothetical protein